MKELLNNKILLIIKSIVEEISNKNLSMYYDYIEYTNYGIISAKVISTLDGYVYNTIIYTCSYPADLDKVLTKFLDKVLTKFSSEILKAIMFLKSNPEFGCLSFEDMMKFEKHKSKRH